MEMLLFMGAQGAGKSTFYRERLFDTHVRVNLDMLATRHREKLLLLACFQMKQRFVVDNTNPTREQRAGYIALARIHGFAVVGYCFESPLEDLRSRNAQRSGKARVPDVAILSTLKKFEHPSPGEGFDRLYRVDTHDGTCTVTEYPHEV
ncbi:MULTISPECIES: ATP-binding protein [Lysobacter]|uniref:ATP-binding protein n=1 Tax=Lysobacter TaxID=68 RepID=UPI001F2DD135|nr:MULTISPECIES: ATP-binding protein [Lysobacter]UJB19739.1 AAA family ATPase [Lysobacter capsici]UJQ26535.1 AAA family ATPase [Lysobacter gummosus]